MMNLKRLFFGFLLLVANIGLAQQSMEFTLKYNSGLNRYEVYCLPNFTQNNFTWGPSQISVVVPASVANTPLPNLTPVAGGGWNDNSLIYAPSIQPQNDFHGVGSLGALTNLVANQELLIFHFTLPGGCVAGVRLFINGVDPDSSQPGMGFGDFGNSIDNGNITDIYASNYDNTGSNCIDAVSDSFSATIAGGIVGNILWNDLLGGVIILPNPSDVVITASVVPGNPIQINTVTGEVFVSPGTPAGTYTLPYTICEATTTGQNLNNCDTATVTVVVGASPIIANYDFYYASNGTTGAPNLGNAYLENDSLNGAPVIVSQIDGSIITGATPAFLGANVPVLDTLTGIVSVPANTPGGTYYIYYQICEVLNLANCDQDSIEIKVDPPVIDAVIDIAGPVLAGQNGIINVLTNDTLNTLPILPGQASDVTVTTLPNSDPELTLNPDGSIDVDPGTPPGLYVLYYQVCEVLNPGNCDDDSVLVTVVSSPIIANADIYGPIDGTNGSPNFGNIFANDSLNGAPVVPGDLTLDPNWNSLSTSPLQVYINPNGTITVEPGTPAGSYIVVYQICETAAIPANSNCDTALVTIVVVPAPEIVNISTPEDTPITICTDTLANLLDPIVSVLPCGAGGPSNGTFVPNPSEGPTCYTYTPNWNFNGTDQACLVSCTASGVCDTTYINIIVTPVNDAPTTNDVNVVTSINTSIGVNVGAGTSDPENNPLTYSFGSATNGGTFTVDGNGTITVTPPTGFTGTITIPFTVCDESIYPVTVLCDQGLITITVVDTTGGINHAPIANTDQTTTPQDVTVTVNAIANDFDVDGDVLDVDLVTTTSPNGTITNNNDGTVTFDPNPDFTGVDTILYTVCDPDGACDTDTIFVYVVPVVDEPNVAPIATDDYVSTPEDVNVVIAVLDNDSDPDGDNLNNPTIILGQGPNNGVVTPIGSGFLYDPNPNFNGTDTFYYVVCDNGLPSLCDTAMVVINVTPVNDAPTTTNVDVVTTINTPVGVNVGAGTSDPENNPLTYDYQDPSTVLNGTYTIDGNGTITVIPDSGFVGDITITFEVCDSSQFQVTSLCDQGTITVTVIDPSSGNNNPPVANNDFVTVPVNTPQVIVNSLGNDFDADGDNLTVSMTGLPTSGGSVVGTALLVNGEVIYFPPAGFTGEVTIPYIICDGQTPNLCDNAVITIVISPVVDEPNVAPIATDDYATTPEGTLVVIAVMDNDSDPDGDVLGNPTIIDGPADGTADVNSDGSITYTPFPGTTDPDTLLYVICDNGNPVLCDTAMVVINFIPDNDAPVAQDDIVSTPEDTEVIIDVLANDTDPNGDNLGAPTIIDAPDFGDAIVLPDGTISYTPDTNYNGPDTFTYVVCDNGSPVLCDTAVVVINVTPVNDAPTTTNVDVVTTINTPVGVNVGAGTSDPENNPLTYDYQDPSTVLNGTYTIDGNGTITVIPDSGFVGDITITFEVCDSSQFQVTSLCDQGTITVTVIDPSSGNNNPPVANNDFATVPVNTPQVIVNPLGNDFDADGDNLTVSMTGLPTSGGSVVGTALLVNGEVIYFPPAGFTGEVTIPYLICDGQTPNLCDNAVITIVISPVVDEPNVAPIATDDYATTPEGTQVVIAVMDNDSDPDGDVLGNPTIIDGPEDGTADVNSDGSITYTPFPGITDPDTLLYVVCDNGNPVLCDTALVVINFIPDNDAPVAQDDVVSTPEDEDITFDVVGNDSDPNGDNLGDPTIIDGPNHGDVVDNGDGTFTYTPIPNYNGPDTITYVICDTGNPVLCDTAIVVIDVTPVNDAPTTTNVDVVTTINTPVGVNVGAGTSDPENNPLTYDYQDPSTVLNGTYTIDGNGTITVIPDSGFVGDITIAFEVCDSSQFQVTSLCDQGTITVTVIDPSSGNNNPPVANNDFTTAPINTPTVTINPFANDFDADGDVLTGVLTGLPLSGGVITGNALGIVNGEVIYYPPPGFTGTVTIPYTICDGGTPNLCDNAVITIVISPVVDEPNVAPIATDDYATTPEGTQVVIAVMDNDSDPDGDVLGNPTIINGPVDGTAVVNSDGSITYTPFPGTTDPDTLLYVICDNGNPVLCDTAMVVINFIPDNDAPVAQDDPITTPEDEEITFDVVGNDSDPNGDNLGDPTIIDGPNHGDVVDNGDGTFTYTPDPNYNGPDTITYVICDTGNPVLCDTAIVVIDVTPVNDAPTTTNVDVVTTINTPVGVNVGAGTSDPENNPLTYDYQDPSTVLNGTYTIDGNGTITVIPDSGFVGDITITFEVCDSSQFQVTSLCDQGTITVTVIDPSSGNNNPPVANNDFTTAPINTPTVTINPFANDFDADGDVLTGVLTGLPLSGGVITGNALGIVNGEVIYYPPPGFTGTVTIPYTICDGGTPNLCDNAVITIVISPVVDEPNVAPIATDDYASTPEVTPITIEVMNNDSDPNGDVLGNPTIIDEPDNGLANVNLSTGTITYNPNPGFVGLDSFEYVICDNGNPVLCDTAMVYINVTGDAESIDAIDDVTATDSDTPVIVDVLDNDLTPLPITCFNIVTQPSAGVAIINPDSTITYVPDETGCGTDSFTYVICDAVSSDTATVIINLNDVTPPTFANCPTDTIVVDAFVNTCWAQVYWPTPVVQDNCGGNNVFVTSNFPNGNVFPVGNHNVILVATDAAGNSDTCEFVVSVVDSQAPVFNLCPVDLNLENDPGVCGAVATWIEPTVFDNCGYTVTVSSFPTLNLGIDSLFPVGTTTMTYIVVDQSGLSDTCTFNVIVTDTEDPVMTNAPGDITVYATQSSCAIQVTWSDPIITDNCGIATTTSSHVNGSVFTPDSTEVTITSVDVNGNILTHTFTVTVLDTIAPVMVSCPSDITISSDPGVCGATAAWPLPVATDNCDNTLEYIVTSEYQLGDLLEVGVHDVVYSITDDSGNEVICSFTVTVEDNEAPVIAGLPTSPVNGCANTPTTWIEPTITDNCGVDQVIITSTTIPNPQSGSVFPVGTTTVTYEAIDVNGNSTTYSFDVVINSSTTVSISGSSKIELCLGESATLSVENPSSSLNYTWSLFNTVVGTGSSYAINGVSADDEGDYTVQVTDGNGCSASDLVEVVVDNCGIRIPEAFTPNGNGQNEVFYIDNLESYPNTEVIIFNRWGSMVYKSDDYKNDWAGVSINKLNIAGDQLPEGTYFYIIKLGGKETDATFGKIYKGYVYIKK